MSKTHVPLNLINPNPLYNANNGTITNPMNGNLDMGSNNIINLASPADPQDAVTLHYLESVLQSTDGFLENPLNEDLNVNNHQILNVNNLTFLDQNQEGVTGYFNLQSGTLQTNLNLNLNTWNSYLGCVNFACTQLSLGSTSSGYHNLVFYGDSLWSVIANTDNSRKYISTLDGDMMNSTISNLAQLSFHGAGTLDCDSSQNLTYNNNVVVTSANVDSYVQQHEWANNASSDLDMNSYSLVSVKNIDFQSDDSAVLTVNENTDLIYNNNKILTQQADVLDSETRAFSLYLPNQSMSMDGVVAGNTSSYVDLSSSVYSNYPLRMSFNISWQIYENLTPPMDESYFLIIGFCNNQNSANSSINVDFIKIDGRAFSLSEGTYSCNVNFQVPTTIEGLTYVNSLGQVLQDFENEPNFHAWYYLKMYATVGGSPMHITSLTGTGIQVYTGTFYNDFYVSLNQADVNQDMVKVNNLPDSDNTFMSFSQGVKNVAQVAGINNLYTVALPPIPTGFTANQIYVKCKVFSVNYMVKFACIVKMDATDGLFIMQDTQEVLYLFNPSNILITPAFVTANNNLMIQNEIADSAIFPNNVCSVKVKLMIINY